MVGRRWLEKRGPGFILLAMAEVLSIRLRFLGFMDDRWIVCIPATGPPTIWDTRENPPKLWEPPSAAFQHGTWNPAVAVDPHDGNIIMGLRK